MLEKITTSLEVSKELADLGVDGLAGFCWWASNNNKFSMIKQHANHRSIESLVDSDFTGGLKYEDITPARTSEELGYVLPQQTKYGKNQPWLTITKDQCGVWVGLYMNINKYPKITKVGLLKDTREVDLSARMLIWLINNNHITVEEVNKKLAEFWTPVQRDHA